MEWPTNLREAVKKGIRPYTPGPAYNEDDVITRMLDEFAAATVYRASGRPEQIDAAVDSVPTTLGAIAPGVLMAEEVITSITFNEHWRTAIDELYAYTRLHAAEICAAYATYPSPWPAVIHQDAQEFWEPETGEENSPG